MKRRFLFLLMTAFTFIGANAAINRANNYLYASNATATAGKTVEVTLNMKNSKTITVWQTELVLPEGITLVGAEATDRWSEEITKNGNKLFSETETAVADGDGVIAKITLQVASTVAAGEYEIALSAIKMVSPEAGDIEKDENKVFKLTVEEPVGIKGDVDGNGSVGVGDIEAVLAIMAGGESTPAADVDGNGSVGVGDIEAILVIMAGGE